MPIYERIESNTRKTYLLIGIFCLLIVAIGWIIGQITGLGIFITAIALIFAIAINIFSWYKSDKIAIRLTGAKPAKREDYLYYYNTVEGLSIAAGLPMPKLYVIEDQTINAFATGRDPEHSAIAVTTGALEKLKRLELEGVLSHELSHIKNKDILIATIVIALVGVVVFLCNITWRMLFFGGLRGRRGKGGGIILLLGLVLIVLAPLFAYIIKFAISRKREFLADADGALLTRYPAGLADALEKIKNENVQLKTANSATAHLFFANPFKKGDWFSNLFSTHPPLDARVKALREM